MRGMLIRMPRSWQTGIHAGLAVLAMALTVLAGNTIGAQVQAPVAKVEVPVAKVEVPAAKVEVPAAKVEAPVAPEPSPVKGPSVARLADGREGFVITEVPTLDEASLRDFDRAVALLTDQDYGRGIELLETVIERSPGVTA